MLLNGDISRLLIEKSKTAFYIKKFVRMVKNQFSRKFQTDQGGEFDNNKLDELYTEEGIVWESTVPYIHEQNGTAEQANWTIQEKARTALIDAGLPNTLWAEALNTAVYLANRSPSGSMAITPYKALYGTPPDLSNLRIFGCTAYVFDKFHAKKGKIGARAWKGVMIGYGEGHNQYCIYNPKKQAIFECQDVKFHEGKNLIPVGDNGRNPTPVGDNSNDSQTESESDLDMGHMQQKLALLPNILRGEDLGHITMPKRWFDHNSRGSCE